jgi:hypothetical protein
MLPLSWRRGIVVPVQMVLHHNFYSANYHFPHGHGLKMRHALHGSDGGEGRGGLQHDDRGTGGRCGACRLLFVAVMVAEAEEKRKAAAMA